MMTRLMLACVAGILLIVTAPRAFAQNISADPLYADLSLDQGFWPDPEVVSVTSGGSIEVDVAGCNYGYVANAPDVDLHYATSGGSDLYFYVEGEGDTTLLINTTKGSWVCNDDGYEGTNPIVVIHDAPAGLYNVWVGSYSSDFHDASLYISEIDPRTSVSSTGTPNYRLDPTYGSEALKAGFLPDPYRKSILAGGSVDLDMGECTFGYVAEAPDFDLRYETSGDANLYIYATGEEDITLLVNTANGEWLCNDDGYNGTDPIVVLPRAAAGLYNIWVGSYRSDLTDAELYISEVDPR